LGSLFSLSPLFLFSLASPSFLPPLAAASSSSPASLPLLSTGSSPRAQGARDPSASCGTAGVGHGSGRWRQRIQAARGSGAARAHGRARAEAGGAAGSWRRRWAQQLGWRAGVGAGAGSKRRRRWRAREEARAAVAGLVRRRLGAGARWLGRGGRPGVRHARECGRCGNRAEASSPQRAVARGVAQARGWISACAAEQSGRWGMDARGRRWSEWRKRVVARQTWS
jgi:hypothetical protein